MPTVIGFDPIIPFVSSATATIPVEVDVRRHEQIRAPNLSKVFGTAPETALERLASDLDKDAIFEQTGSVVAVADVSFAVGQGEVLVVMGLSGSGKSTLVRCINRLIEPSAGALWIDDDDVLALDREQLRQLRLRKVAMVFQHFALAVDPEVVNESLMTPQGV